MRAAALVGLECDVYANSLSSDLSSSTALPTPPTCSANRRASTN